MLRRGNVASCVEGSWLRPGAERPVGCHLDASQLNSAEHGAECSCEWKSEYSSGWNHVRFTTGLLLRWAAHPTLLQHEVYVHSIYNFSSYFTENTASIYKALNVVGTLIRDKQMHCVGKLHTFLMIKQMVCIFTALKGLILESLDGCKVTA